MAKVPIKLYKRNSQIHTGSIQDWGGYYLWRNKPEDFWGLFQIHLLRFLETFVTWSEIKVSHFTALASAAEIKLQFETIWWLLNLIHMLHPINHITHINTAWNLAAENHFKGLLIVLPDGEQESCSQETHPSGGMAFPLWEWPMWMLLRSWFQRDPPA